MEQDIFISTRESISFPGVGDGFLRLRAAWDMWKKRHHQLAMVVVEGGDIFAELGAMERVEAWRRRKEGKLNKGVLARKKNRGLEEKFSKVAME